MTTRQKLAITVIAVLLALYALKFSGVGGSWTGAHSVADARIESAMLLDEVEAVRHQLQTQRQAKADFDALAQRFWRANPEPPTNEIQTAIQSLGAATDMRLNRLGAPRMNTLSDRLMAVDVEVNTTTSVEALNAFLRAIDEHQPVLEWTNCTIRPTPPNAPTSVIVTGRIRAYVVLPGAALIATGPTKGPGAPASPGSTIPSGRR